MISPFRNLILLAWCTAFLTSALNANASDLRSLQDPTENAYTLELPIGWNNQLGIRRTNGEHQIPRQWATSSSPDGQTRWFIGDTNLPFFQSKIPQQTLAATGMHPQQAQAAMADYLRQKGIVLLPYQSASRFGADYAQRRYGREPGFRIVETAPNPQLAQAMDRQSKALGVPPIQSSTATVRFEYAGHSGEIWANTAPLNGAPDMWSADVSGFTTSGDRGSATELFSRAAVSLDINKAWLQAEEQRSAQRNAAIAQRQQQQQQMQMQNSNAQHQARMQALRNQAKGHQDRMAANSAAADIRNQTWTNNQNSNYQQHQSFVRGINDQTLVSPGSNSYESGATNYGGNSYEVDAGYNNYYVDDLNNQYIGTDQPLQPGQLPNGYRPAAETSGNW